MSFDTVAVARAFSDAARGGTWTLGLITVTYALFLLNTARCTTAICGRLWRLIFENEELLVTTSEAGNAPRPRAAPRGEFTRHDEP